MFLFSKYQRKCLNCQQYINVNGLIIMLITRFNLFLFCDDLMYTAPHSNCLDRVPYMQFINIIINIDNKFHHTIQFKIQLHTSPGQWRMGSWMMTGVFY